MENSVDDESDVCSLPTSIYKTSPKKKQKKGEPVQDASTQYCQKFVDSWLTDPQLKGWLKKKSSYLGYCAVCNTDLKLGKSGKSELVKHAKTKKHLSKSDADASASKNPLDQFLQGGFTDQTKLLEARICSFLVENDLAISKVEPLVDFLKSLPSKQVVDNVRLKKQKATNVIRTGLSGFYEERLTETLQNRCFSVIIDESTDVSTKKLLAVGVIFCRPFS